MLVLVPEKDYKMNVYRDKGKGFYPITFITSIVTSISIVLQNYIFTLFAILMLGLLALIISIAKTLNDVKNLGDISISYSTLTIIENEQINIKMELKHQLFEVLRINNALIISDIGIKISKTIPRKIKNLLTIEILIHGYSGRHQIKEFIIFLEDPFLYFRYRIEILLKESLYIDIIPKQLYMEINVERNIPYISYEAHLSKHKGLGTNILGIREYFPGDDYRKIDWKATARALRLMVKEFETHLYRNVIFIVSIHDKFFLGDPPAIEILLQLLLNLSIRIVESGLNLGIGVITEREILVSNKITKHNLKYIYTLLASVTWPLIIEKKNYSSANRIIHWFVNELVGRFCSESCLVVIFMDVIDDLDIENLKRILKELMIRRYILKTFLINPTLIRFITSSIDVEEFKDLNNEINMYKHVVKHFKEYNIISSIADLL
jgi:hypothetical protein